MQDGSNWVDRQLVDGDAARPALRFLREVSLGIYRRAAGVLGISKGIAATTFEGTDTTEATSQTDAPMKTAGGLAVVKKGYFGGLIHAVGGAVVFPATQVASADVNALDDYEEGTFTPGLTFGGAAVDMTFAATRNGFYTKIGDRVFFSLYFILTNKGTSAGNAVVTGLPFTTNATASIYLPPVLRLDVITFANFPQAYISPSDTIITLGELTEAGVGSALTNADFANTSEVMIMGVYRV